MLSSITQSIAALDFAGVFLLIGGLFLINFSEKIVESDNKKRVANGKPALTDDEQHRKVRFFRIIGNVLAAIFLVWIVVQFVDVHFFTDV